jgi:hypothetical protein
MEIRRIVKSWWLAALLLVAPCLGVVDSAAQDEPAETEAADTVAQPAEMGVSDTLAEPVGTVAADTLVDDAGNAAQDISDHGQDVADIKVGVEEISQGVQTILRTITLGHLLFAGLVVAAAVLALLLAYRSRNSLLSGVVDRDGFARLFMQQTLGLPQGTVRGVLALVVAMVYVGTVLLYGGSQIPDLVKVITAMTFGYYFAKKSDQVTNATDALLGRLKQGPGQPPEAGPAAERVAGERAALAAATQRRNEENELNAAAAAINQQLAGLDQNEQVAAARSRLDETRAHTDAGRTDDARQALRRAEGLADHLLREEREAETEARTAITDPEREQIRQAKETLDGAGLPAGVDGRKMLEMLFAIVGNIKDEDARYLEPFKKRLMGLSLDREDLEQIVGDSASSEILTQLRRAVELAGISRKLTRRIPEDLLEQLGSPERLKEIMLGDRETLERLYHDVAQEVESNDFYTFVNKARRKLVDRKLVGLIAKVLPSGVGMEEYAGILKQIREQGGGGEGAISTIVSLADKALPLISGGGALRAGLKLAKGLTRLF